jgi:hypothetical protein
LIEAIVEKVIVPFIDKNPTLHSIKNEPPPVTIGEKMLRQALAKSDCESIVYDAHLGTQSTFNCAKLSHAFSAGLKSCVVAKAEDSAKAEAVRILDDAYASVKDIDFIGQATVSYMNRHYLTDPKNGMFYTLPTKQSFSDHNSKLYFETTIQNLGGSRAIQSLPTLIRNQI